MLSERKDALYHSNKFFLCVETALLQCGHFSTHAFDRKLTSVPMFSQMGKGISVSRPIYAWVKALLFLGYCSLVVLEK